MSIDRILSLAVAVCWLIAAFAVGPLDDGGGGGGGGGKVLLTVVCSLLLALGLIWYGEELGDYVGPAGRGNITQRTPGCMVKFFGWAMLLGMVGLWVYTLVTRKTS